MDIQEIIENFRQKGQDLFDEADGFLIENHILRMAGVGIIVILLLMGTFYLLYQNPSEKSLKIVDKNKKPVKGASVTVYNEKGILITSKKTDEKGYLKMDAALFNQTYSYVIEKAGFENASIKALNASFIEVALEESKDIGVYQNPSNKTMTGPTPQEPMEQQPRPSTDPQDTNGSLPSPLTNPYENTNGTENQSATPTLDGGTRIENRNPTIKPRTFGPPKTYPVCKNEIIQFSSFLYKLVDLTELAAAFDVTEKGNTICAARTLPCSYLVGISSPENEGLESATKVKVKLGAVNTTTGCAIIDVAQVS